MKSQNASCVNATRRDTRDDKKIRETTRRDKSDDTERHKRRQEEKIYASFFFEIEIVHQVSVCFNSLLNISFKSIFHCKLQLRPRSRTAVNIKPFIFYVQAAQPDQFEVEPMYFSFRKIHNLSQIYCSNLKSGFIPCVAIFF